MIKMSLIMILIIGTANAINIGATTTTNSGITFSDGITMNGDITAHGEYFLGGRCVAEDTTVKLGSGNFGEDTKIQFGGGIPHHAHMDVSSLHMDISKIAKNSGSGTALSKTQSCICGQFVDIRSYLQTNSAIDNGEMHSFLDNDFGDVNKADATWHYENVQAESGLSFDGSGILIIPMKIEASSLPLP